MCVPGFLKVPHKWNENLEDFCLQEIPNSETIQNSQSADLLITETSTPIYSLELLCLCYSLAEIPQFWFTKKSRKGSYDTKWSSVALCRIAFDKNLVERLLVKVQG